MNLLFPRIALRHLPLMFTIAGTGALIAGTYGILHDQVTYTLSEEYFTKFKAIQFQWADLGWPRRLYVALIGFLATWWVGLIAGWFLARLTVPHLPRESAMRRCFSGFTIVFVLALIGGLTGAGLGWMTMRAGAGAIASWTSFSDAYGVKDLGHFVWVGYIHNASYLGGLIGLIAALIQARRLRRRDMEAAATH